GCGTPHTSTRDRPRKLPCTPESRAATAPGRTCRTVPQRTSSGAWASRRAPLREPQPDRREPERREEREKGIALVAPLLRLGRRGGGLVLQYRFGDRRRQGPGLFDVAEQRQNHEEVEEIVG